MSEPVKEQPEPPKKRVIKTLTELYLDNRLEMPACENQYQYFMRIRESINIGSSMLNHDDPLKKRANDALNDDRNKSIKNDMKYLDSRGIYACSSGYGNTGKVTVRPEELEIGKSTLRDQQAGDIIQRLSSLDREILDALLEQKKVKMQSMSERIEAELGL